MDNDHSDRSFIVVRDDFEEKFKFFDVLLEQQNNRYCVGQEILGKIIFQDTRLIHQIRNGSIRFGFFGSIHIFRTKRLCLFRSSSSFSSEIDRAEEETLIIEFIEIDSKRFRRLSLRNDNHERNKDWIAIDFQYRIPKYLPNSFSLKQKVSIQYYLKVVFVQSQLEFTKNLKEIIVSSNPNIPKYYSSNPMTATIDQRILNYWQCFKTSTESIHLKCLLSIIGGKIDHGLFINIIIENRSSRSFPVVIKLEQSINVLKKQTNSIEAFTTLRSNDNIENRSPTRKKFKQNILEKFITQIEPDCLVHHSTSIKLPSKILFINHNHHHQLRSIRIEHQLEVILRISWRKKLRCRLPIIFTNEKFDR